MIQFTNPSNLDGAKLREELRASGVNISDAMASVTLDDNKILWLDIDQKDATKAATVVENHQG
jgi:hypothetical protein